MVASRRLQAVSLLAGVIALVSSENLRAGCGDYLELPGASHAHPMHSKPKPCNGPECRRGNDSPLAPTTPIATSTVSSQDAIAPHTVDALPSRRSPIADGETADSGTHLVSDLLRPPRS